VPDDGDTKTAEEAVVEANLGFYRAFESLDIDRMATVWAKDDTVRCVHPGWSMLEGWNDVMESWERIFDNSAMMKFIITGTQVSVEEDWAWVVCTENLTSLVNGQVVDSKIEATNIFRSRHGHWAIVHHHGSPVMG